MILDDELLFGAPREQLLSSILWHSHRDYVPIRRSFLQSQDDLYQPGVAAAFVVERRELALDVFLLLHALMSSPPYTESMPLDVWRELLGLSHTRKQSAEAQLRRSLRWLHEMRLVSLRDAEEPVVSLLNEGFEDRDYTHPVDTEDSYLTLPNAYWTERWDQCLDLPAKLVLLIARSLRHEDFLLPGAQGATWYGVSAPTIQRGLASLRKAGLLRTTYVRRPAVGSPWGEKIERRHTLMGAFARTAGSSSES